MTTATTAKPRPPGRRGQTPASAPTWDQLVAREPLLAALLEEIRAIRPRKGWCAHRVWFGYFDPALGFKERMSQLVGWDRSDDRLLGTQEAYDVAYDTLYDALPHCRHAGIFC